jgi:hypothetical protein
LTVAAEEGNQQLKAAAKHPKVPNKAKVEPKPELNAPAKPEAKAVTKNTASPAVDKATPSSADAVVEPIDVPKSTVLSSETPDINPDDEPPFDEGDPFNADFNEMVAGDVF